MEKFYNRQSNPGNEMLVRRTVATNYLVSDKDGTWTVMVPLNEEDLDAIHTHEVTYQVEQICRDTIDRAIRLALAEQSENRYDESMEIDLDTLTFNPDFKRA